MSRGELERALRNRAGRRRFGGGYTDLAIVADAHPAHHIMHAWRYFSSSSLRALRTNARINAHTTAQPKL